MRRNIKALLLVTLIISAIFFFVAAIPAHALEKDSHEYLMKYILNASSLDSYLIDNLGFASGIKSAVGNKTILKWLEKGGIEEDEPLFTRSLNHFHDPLKPWSSAGLKGTSKSALLWAQDQGAFGSLFGGNWSWKKARDSFYTGLTNTTETGRDNKLADTFRALGQVIHLVQDSSVPAHTRNDIHLYIDSLKMGYHYEVWVNQNHQQLNVTPRPFDKAILDITPESSAPIPIANIFDTNKYVGSNPEVTPGNLIGFSEYTNANFFSEGTIFSGAYPYPAWSSVVEYNEADATGKLRTYLKKTNDGETATHLAAGTWLYKYLPSGLKGLGLKLDRKVYTDYAEKLIPRAIGYSTGLLNYFFRGGMDMVTDTTTGSGYAVLNNSDEDMNGLFELWYDNTNNDRLKAWSGTLSVTSKNSADNKSANITFTPPTDAKEDGKYLLVFRGKLGNEEGAVIGQKLELQDKAFLFMIDSNYQKYVFEMKTVNTQYQLSPVTKVISVTTSLNSFNPTIQSNPAKTEHYATMPDLSRDSISRYGLSTYGYTDWRGYAHNLTTGAPYCFRPQDFTKGSAYILGSETDKAAADYMDGIYASGRKNYTLDTNGTMTAYWNSIWRKYIGGEAYQYYFRYKEAINGSWIDGSILATDEQMPNQATLAFQNGPIASIGKDKALIMSTRNDEINRAPIYTTLSATSQITSTNTGSCSLSGNIVQTTYAASSEKHATAEGYSGDQYIHTDKLQIGDLLLEEAIYRTGGSSDGHGDISGDWGGSWQGVTFELNTTGSCNSYDPYVVGGGSNTITSSYSDSAKRGFFPDPLCSYCGSMQYSEFENYQRGERILNVMDYDNKDEDATFIIFYAKTVTDNSNGGKQSFLGSGGSSPLETSTNNSSSTDYMLTYRINRGAVSKIKLASNNQKSTQVTTAVSYNAPTNRFTYNDTTPWTETWIGQRITGVSSQINDKNMVYTYIVEKLNGAKWTFDKRIVGIINISDSALPVGYRQEFLPDFSGTNFNSEEAAAIGVTK